jgi:methionine synthase II (cobalamin-independent)
MGLKGASLQTTVIGSFPLKHSEQNFHLALEDQINAGIDYPSVPQLKDFCLMFLEPLATQGCGIKILNDEAWLTSPLSLPKDSIVSDDIRETLSFLSRREALNRVRGIKLSVTGPITLSSVTKVTADKYAISYPELILQFSEVVKAIILEATASGVAMIFLDEPSLPYARWIGVPENVILDAVNQALRGAKNVITGLHVCGDIRGLGQLLLNTEASILHHEFKSSPQNLKEYSRDDVEKYGKLIGLGCVRSKPSLNGTIEVESTREIEDFILNAAQKFGFENLAIAPDCGFKSLASLFNDERKAQQLVFQKLKAMVQAVKNIKYRLSSNIP